MHAARRKNNPLASAMARGRFFLLAALLLAGTTVVLLQSCGGGSGPSLQDRSHEAGTRAAALTAKSIATEDLPPAGTRSLFDHLIAQNDVLPYPFEKLVALVQKQDPDNKPPLTLLIPQGRSLLKAQADFVHPRLLVGADFQALNTPAALGLSSRGQLFMGFVENAHEIEVISYNEAAGRFEFQLVQDYREGGQPRIVYARRAICTTCHQAGAPIFPQRPWNETNGQPEIAAAIRNARNSDAPYLGVPLNNALAVPERFDELAEVSNFIVTTQKIWIDACADSADCRRQMLKVALRYLWNPAEFNAAQADAQTLRALQTRHWPAEGIAVGQKSLHNRDSLEESRGIRGWLHALLTPKSTEPGAKTNEDLDAFERLPKLPAALDPLTPRPPLRVLTAQDIDGAFGLASMITLADFKQLEQAAGFQQDRLLAAVDQTDAALFAPTPFSRVKIMQGLLIALGNKTAPDYCCLNTLELSPPIALGVPPLKITDGSVLKHFEHYCFACHRGNPAKRLNFMAGASEEETLVNIKHKTEIRDALDWERYKGTDKANKLMPPADSHQHAALQADLAKNPALLEEMRKTVPSLFDF
jgi:hypothetical protein